MPSDATGNPSTTVGHPVDVVSGAVFTAWRDFDIPGYCPFVWQRVYKSTDVEPGPLGRGWHTLYDARLSRVNGRLDFVDDEGVQLSLVEPENGQRVNHPELRHETLRAGDEYTVRNWGDGHVFTFGELPGGGFRLIAAGAHDAELAFLQYSGNHLARISDESGRYLRLVRDGAGLISSILFHYHPSEEPVPLVSFEYDQYARLVAVYDRLGQPITYAYDESHRVIRETNRHGMSFHFEYDSAGRCVHTWGDGGYLRRHLVFAPRQRRTTVTDGLGHVSTYEYDARGLITRYTNPTGAVSQSFYDVAGRLLMTVSPSGGATQFAYDNAGHLISVTDPLGNTAKSVFNQDHRLIESVDPTGGRWIIERDAAGRRLREIGPMGETQSYRYDTRGHLTHAIDPAGSEQRLGWDEHGHLLFITDWEGHETGFEHDPLGHLLTEHLPDRSAMRHTYDALGRLIETTYPDGTRETTEYDDRSNTVKHREPNGAETVLITHPWGALSRRRDPLGHTVALEHDVEGRLVRIADEAGRILTNVYDPAGRLIERIGFDGRRERFRHNPDGRIVEYINARGQSLQLVYDAAGRLVARVHESGQEDRYAYDAAGRLIAAENANNAIRLERDLSGRVTAEIQGEIAVHTEYDVLSNPVEISWHGAEVGFVYNRNSELVEVQLPGERRLRSKRDVLGREVERLIPSGTSANFEYDRSGRLARHILTGAGISLLERRYEYDAVGNVTLIDDSARGSVRREYDLRGQLLSAVHRKAGTTRAEEFRYDPAGNLVFSTSTGQIAYGPGNRSRSAGIEEFQYDADGNLTVRSSERRSERLLYDDLGQFVALARDGATAPVTFEYDAIGRRVAKDDGSLRTTFVWRGPALIGEVRGAAGTSAWVYCPDDIEPLCRLDGDNALYYSADQNFTPFELRTAWGGVAWSVDYDALGRATPLDNPRLADPLRMPGQYFDRETGLHYNCFRYYDPLHGRFIAQDPAGLTAGLNPYLFAPNPYSWVDPLGLTCNRGNAAGALPRFKGKSVAQIQRQLTRAGFTRTNPNNPRNQTWRHPDGSEVRIHAYGNLATGPWRAGNNAHVHKDAPAPAPGQPRIPLDDWGHPTTRPGEIHIGIRNPADFPTVAGRDHGTGTEGRQNPASQYYSYSPP